MLAAGVVPAGAVVLALPAAGAPVAPVGDAAGAGVGSDVSGVGSGGNGLELTLAMYSVKPVSVLLCRYLYQPVRLSIQMGFCCANAASLPASATARA